MKNISENVREVGKASYWSTDNPNIIIALTTISEEIHLDKLTARISELETKVASTPDVRTFTVDNTAEKSQANTELNILKLIKAAMLL